MLAITPSRPKRAISGGAMCCACSMRKRRSRGPVSLSTRAKMSSCVRIARSPIACTITCSPAASALLVHAYRLSGGVTKKPLSLGESLNGASIAAVCDPSEPSTNPFSPPMCSHSSPRPFFFTSSRKRAHVASGTCATIRVRSVCASCARRTVASPSQSPM